MPPAIPDRIATQIRIDKKLYSVLKLIAQWEHRNLNAQIAYFLDVSAVKYLEKHGLINAYVDAQEEQGGGS